MTSVTFAATLLATYLLQSLACCALALGAARLVSRPRDRDIIWKLALVGPILIAVAVTVGPWRTTGRIDLTALPRRSLPHSLAGVNVRRDETRTIGRAPVREDRVSDPLGDVLSVLIVLAIAGRSAFLARRLHRRRRAQFAPIANRCPVDFPPVVPKMTRRAVRMTMSDSANSPLALPGGEICVPEKSFGALTPEQQASVLAHECAHLDRRDPEWLALAEWIAALTSWQPLIDLVVTRFRRDAEFISDEAAVRRIGSAVPLVESLALFARRWDVASAESVMSYDSSPLAERAARALALEPDAGRGWLTGAVIALLIAAGASRLPALSTRFVLDPQRSAGSRGAREMRDTVVILRDRNSSR